MKVDVFASPLTLTSNDGDGNRHLGNGGLNDGVGVIQAEPDLESARRQIERAEKARLIDGAVPGIDEFGWGAKEVSPSRASSAARVELRGLTGHHEQ